MKRSLAFTAVGLAVVGLLAFLSTRPTEPARTDVLPAHPLTLATASAAPPADAPKVEPPKVEPLTVPSKAGAGETKPEFVTKAARDYAAAADLLHSKERAKALAALKALAADDKLPQELLASVNQDLVEAAGPELTPEQKVLLKQSTAALLAGEELERQDEQSGELRPEKKLAYAPRQEAVATLKRLTAAAPKSMPAHLSLGLAHEGLNEFAEAAKAYAQYLALHDGYELPASAQQREVRRRLHVVKAKATIDAELTKLVPGKWTASYSDDGGAVFARGQLIELKADGTIAGRNPEQRWWVQNRQLLVGGTTTDGLEWLNAGPLSPNGQFMIGMTLDGPPHRCKYVRSQ